MGQSYTKLNEETKIKSTENINFDLRVEQINACIDNQLTEIDEKSKSVLKYKTPYFRYNQTNKLYKINLKQFFLLNFFELEQMLQLGFLL